MYIDYELYSALRPLKPADLRVVRSVAATCCGLGKKDISSLSRVSMKRPT